MWSFCVPAPGMVFLLYSISFHSPRICMLSSFIKLIGDFNLALGVCEREWLNVGARQNEQDSAAVKHK